MSRDPGKPFTAYSWPVRHSAGMRTSGAILLIGCLAAVPVAAQGQTSILPPTATLNPHGDAPRTDALSAHGEVGGGLAGALGGAPHAAERIRHGENGHPPHGRICFNPAEAREMIAVHRLVDPVRALRSGRQQGDALSAKLCRWWFDEFVYEVNVLRHDGRILRLYMNAQNGEAVSGQVPVGQVQAGAPGVRAPDRDR